jgi:hypothetical protein
MLKKLCMFFVALGLCFGTIGCGDGKVETPENPEPPPTEAPGEAEMSIEPPDEG